MKKIYYMLLILPLLLTVSCSVSDTEDRGVSGDWLIPKDQVFDGGPGRDGIPAIDNPDFASATTINFLNDNDLVIGIKIDSEIKAYPHPIMDWHEIINDEINGHKFTLTYCPLTGSAIAWDRVINGSETTFGVSGLLYNTNLIPFDRASRSNYSQMALLSVNGANIGQAVKTYQVIETTWGIWRSIYPKSKVVTTNTGFSRSYGVYPYGDYKENNDFLLFPINHEDGRLTRKVRVLGVLTNGLAKAYNMSTFGNGVAVINETLTDKKVVIAGSTDKNFAVAYERATDKGEVGELEAVQNALPVIFKDTDGNMYDMFGMVTAGQRRGQRLKPVTSFIAYWFAWAAFYPQTQLKN